MRIFVRARAVGFASAVAIAGLGAVGPLQASATESTPTTWHLTVGTGDPNSFFLGANRFYIPAITVHQGDTVEFGWGGFHTVTFNPPSGKSVLDFAFPPGLQGPNTCPAGSPAALRCLDTPTEFVNGVPAGGPGPGGPPPAFDVRIGDHLPTGTYHYQCMLHQYMHGAIKVVAPDKHLPKTDAQVQAEASALMFADVQRARALDAAFTQRSGGDENEGGATVGAGDRVVEAIKFYPESFTIRSGQSVTWVNRDPHDPHSVTLGTDPGIPAEFFPSASSGTTYGGGNLNSGYLFSQSQANYWNLAASPLASLAPTTRYTIRFVNNGSGPVTYNFFCVIHSQIDPVSGVRFGMQGWVTVLPSNDD
jgi:plastocyanin